MSSELDYGKVSEMLAVARELEGAALEKFLASLEPAYRAEVESLLAYDDTESESPVSVGGEGAGSRPESIGPYRILDVLGEGGMGTVYLAEQKEPVRRRVALKVIKLGMDTADVLRRFDAERQALSMMEHDSIARVLDAGTSESGRAYFAMEYVRGIPISQYCDDNRLTLRERLELFRQVCAGVQHAHQKGVIHRDLKPSNILVTVQGDHPIPKIIDFGLARATDHRLVEATIFTEIGQIIGTPEYMSPEQAGLGGLDIDTRTDVYSLGVLLYELLTGELPFSSEDLRRAGLLEIQRCVREVEPPKPSTRLTSSADHGARAAQLRRIDDRTLLRDLRGELDWVVMKALEKDRTRRYGTPEALADDVRRYLVNEAVLATPPSLGYRARKFLARNKVAAVVGLIVSASLVAGTIGFVWAEIERRESNRLNTELNSVLNDVELLNVRDRAEFLDGTRDALPPAWPEHLDELRAVTERAEALVARAPEVEAGLERLLAGGGRHEEEERAFLRSAFERTRFELERFEQGALVDLRERCAWAQTVAANSVDAHREAWRHAIEAIAASDVYSGLEIAPQYGLVPIGPDPKSKLWEFHHLRTSGGSLTRPDSGGRVQLTESSGLVFVLIPPGVVNMGEGAVSNPLDLHAEVSLDAFFLSKFELTQAQWLRLSGEDNPSDYFIGRELAGRVVSPTHPVESVSWTSADTVLRRHGLSMPTEAQWEFACRAGSTKSWATGDSPESLQDFANVADDSISPENAAANSIAPFREIRDGHIIHAPVGSFDPNEFGLHDMHGNVHEWCRDVFVTAREHSLDFAAGSGLARHPEDVVTGSHPFRGGAWNVAPASGRCASRVGKDATGVYFSVGIRPARPILDH